MWRVLVTPETAGAIVIRSEESQNGNIIPLRLGDIATIDVTAKKRQSFRRLNGDDAVIINIIREQGTNVVKTMDELKDVIEKAHIARSKAEAERGRNRERHRARAEQARRQLVEAKVDRHRAQEPRTERRRLAATKRQRTRVCTASGSSMEQVEAR